MLLYMDPQVSFADPQIQEFIFDQDPMRTRLELTPPAKPGFSHDAEDQRRNPEAATQLVKYLVRELWQLEQRGGQVGVNTAIVCYEQPVDIGISYWLLFSDGAPDAAKTQARTLLAAYNPVQHGGDIRAWVRSNVTLPLTMDMFVLESVTTLDKYSARIEHDIRQREVLFQSLGQLESTQPIGRLHGLDETLDHWANRNGITLRLIGEELVRETQPPKGRDVREVPPGQGGALAGGIVDEILAVVVPATCGRMTRREIELLTLSDWPEFRLVWDPLRITIGCSTVTVWFPRLETRISRLLFYVYFSIPEDVPDTVRRIAETCAIRAALGGGVVGVISGNGAAAVVAFNGLFKACIEREILNCVHSGILTLKESGPWA